MSRWKKSTMKRTPKTILRHSTYNIWEERISLFVTANKHTWRKTTCGRDNREILYYLTFSGATSSRKNAPDWFIRFPVYKRRFHFRAGTGPTESQSARPWKGFVCLSYKPFNFRATFQFLSADARSFAVFNSTSPPSHALCPLPPIPVIHIADAGFRYFRFGDGLTLPIQNYRVPFTIACIRCLFSTEA